MATTGETLAVPSTRDVGGQARSDATSLRTLQALGDDYFCKEVASRYYLAKGLATVMTVLVGVLAVIFALTVGLLLFALTQTGVDNFAKLSSAAAAVATGGLAAFVVSRWSDAATARNEALAYWQEMIEKQICPNEAPQLGLLERRR
jgi:hypothetical protein